MNILKQRQEFYITAIALLCCAVVFALAIHYGKVIFAVWDGINLIWLSILAGLFWEKRK